VCMCACVHACVRACVHACMCACMRVSMCVSVCVCLCTADYFVAQLSYAIKRSADITDNVAHIKSCQLSRGEQQQVCC